MVKKIGTLLAALAIVASGSIAVYAAERSEKPLWGIIADSFKDFKVLRRLKTDKKVSIFQSMHDGIKEGSEKARNKSLRGGK